MRSNTNILGYAIDSGGIEAAISDAWTLVKDGQSGRYMACANPHSLVEARRDTAFASALRQADILLPDGTGIILAARLLGRPLHERVAGFEFFQGLSERAERHGGLSYFFLGSTDEVLSLITHRLARDFPSIRVAGTYSPPFRDQFTDEDNEAILKAVNQSGADVLWVGMTAPKQEKWILAHRERLQVPFCGAIGAVFDFYAGTRKRAPRWICRLGLEWLPRLLREPARLWRRNFVSSPLFLAMVFAEMIRRPNVS
ncbi:MAG TPA: WecB/TagA/CpsF family glycosyltransferase [Azospirillaceae bacterium]|nr:WecB/TagA/CpsF family glycosyltransferase [Azospirillaceae bacterium]